MSIIIQWPNKWIFKNKGLTIKPLIFVYSKDDKCLIAHEIIHIKQQKVPFPFNLPWLVRWLVDKDFRKRMEAEANKVQQECLDALG